MKTRGAPGVGITLILLMVGVIGALAQEEDSVERRINDYKKQREARIKEALTMRVAQWDKEAKLVRRERAKKPASPPRRRGAQLQAASAQAEKAVEVKEVKAGTALVVGDALTTGEKRGVTVHAGAVGVQRIQPNSAVRYVSFDPPALDPTKKSTIELELTRGEVLHRTGKLASGSIYRSRSTPRLAASAGTAYAVRLVGTEFEILVAEGEVKVALESKPTETLSIGPRQKALVGQALPEAPLPVTPEDEARVRRVLSVPIDSLIGYTDPVELRREDAEEIVAIEVRPTLLVERVPLGQARWREYSVVVPDDKTFWTVDRFGERREVGKGFQFLAAAKAGDVILALDPKTKELWSFDLEGNKRFVASDFEGLLSLAPNGSRAVVKLRRWVPIEGSDKTGLRRQIDIFVVSTRGFSEQRLVDALADRQEPEFHWRKAGSRLFIVRRWQEVDSSVEDSKIYTGVAVSDHSLGSSWVKELGRTPPAPEKEEMPDGTIFEKKMDRALSKWLEVPGESRVWISASGRWVIGMAGDGTKIHDVDAGTGVTIGEAAEFREIAGSDALLVRLVSGSAIRVEGQEQPSSPLQEGVRPSIAPVTNADEVRSDPSVFAYSPNGELITFRSSKTGTAHVADSLDLKRFSDVYVGIAPQYECEWVSGDTVYYREVKIKEGETRADEFLIRLAVKREGSRPRRFFEPMFADANLTTSPFVIDRSAGASITGVLRDGSIMWAIKTSDGHYRSLIYNFNTFGLQTIDAILEREAPDGVIYGVDIAILQDGRRVELPTPEPNEDGTLILPNGNLLIEGNRQWDPRDTTRHYPVGNGRPIGGRIFDVPWVPEGARIKQINSSGQFLYVVRDLKLDRVNRFWVGDGQSVPKLAESRLTYYEAEALKLGDDGQVYFDNQMLRSAVQDAQLPYRLYRVGLLGAPVLVYETESTELFRVAGATAEGIVYGKLLEGTAPPYVLNSFVIVGRELVKLNTRAPLGWELYVDQVLPSGAMLGEFTKDGRSVLVVPNLYGLLSLSTGKTTTAAPRPGVEGLPAGEYEGALFRNGRRDESGQDLAVKAATEIRLTIGPDGTYRIFNAGAGPGQTDGQPTLIATGEATLDGANLVLRPSQKAAAFAFYGVRLDSELRLRVEPDGTLSVHARPGGLGQAELRFVKRRT